MMVYIIFYRIAHDDCECDTQSENQPSGHVKPPFISIIKYVLF